MTAAAGMTVGAVGVGRNATVVLITPEEIGEVSKKNARAHGPPLGSTRIGSSPRPLIDELRAAARTAGIALLRSCILLPVSSGVTTIGSCLPHRSLCPATVLY